MFEGVGLIGGADVDPQVAELQYLAPLLGREQVDRLLADHPNDIALFAQYPHPLTDQYLRIPTPDATKRQMPLVVGVGDDQPDLVDMPGHHDAGPATGVEGGEHVAVGIAADVLAEGLGPATPHRGRPGFERARPRGLEQGL